MPRLPSTTLRRKSLDSEVTGVDLHHGAKPYLVTFCNDDGFNTFFEWDVDPETREPIIPDGELEEIEREIEDCDELVLQNPKFDFAALDTVAEIVWPWEKVRDTLSAGHLLASNQPHDLTTMAMVYLGINIQPFEDRVEAATVEARRIAKQKYPTWKLAKEGQEGMPSAKGSDKNKRKRGEDKDRAWKFDMWLPRALIKEAIFSGSYSIVPSDPRMPTIGRVGKARGVRIDRTTKWGNPFVIGKDGDRATVIRKYAEYIWKKPELLADLPELFNQTLLCFCTPEECHGDVLRILCSPWLTATQEYANADSSVTLPLYKKQLELINERRLTKIYFNFALPRLPAIYRQETRGVTINDKHLEESRQEFTEVAEKCRSVCLTLAEGEMEDLPVNGVSNALKKVVFEKFNLKTEKKTKTGMSMDKYVLDEWLVTLPERTKPHTFVKNLRAYRKRKTALGYMASYDKYRQPLTSYLAPHYTSRSLEEGYSIIYPSTNPTGTDTLRFSMANPNGQQVSKQEETNLRYAFGPAPDREWWSLDAKNIELRIPAYEAGETEMIALFERPKDPPYFGSYHLLIFDTLHPDKFALHGAKSKDVYESTWYQWTKNGNFAVQYGAQEASGTADKAYHVPGAQRRIQGRFTKISELNQRMIKLAEKYGYVETMPDKKVDPTRGYPLLCSRTRWGGILPTVPLSYHVQGTAMWWMTGAMIRCDEYLEELNRESSDGYFMIMQIHDELLFDFPRRYRPATDKAPAWYGNYEKIMTIKSLMEEGGERIGVPTPVSCKYHDKAWSLGVSV